MEINGIAAVITGGASGLGAACARLLVEGGARVSLWDMVQEKEEALVSELGGAAIFCRTDVSDEESVKAAVDKTMASFGAIHVAINCAGAIAPAKVLSRKGPLDMDVFKRVVSVNLFGTMNVIRLAAQQMVKNSPNEDGEKGVVINTASVVAFDGPIGQSAYGASKAGVIGVTLLIAREFAPYGIRLNTLAPGMFDTPGLRNSVPQQAIDSQIEMIPFPKRLGRPIEFAKLAQHVIENPMLNGETIRLDGATRMAAQ